MQYQGLVISVPKEIMPGEKRVAATPETVKKLVSLGATVLVEQSAGLGSYFSDAEYVESGATIVNNVEEIFSKADIIFKVKEPQFNQQLKKHEVDLMKAGQVLVTFLHPAAPANHGMIQNLTAKGVTALTLDGIPRISRAQAMDALTSMSTVAGYKSVLMAADRVPKFLPMIGTAIGMMPPANVIVLGAGVAGLQAIATAKRLGAVVYAADIRPEAAEHAKSLGAKLVDTGVPAEIAIGQGGYAKSLPQEWIVKEQSALYDAIINSDIVIATALVPGRMAPILITEDMVKAMKPGSAIVDVSIDQGGNCALTVGGELIERHGVSIDGTKNIPGMVATSSTSMFSKNILNFVANIVKDGKIIIDTNDEITASTLVCQNGQLVHAGTREALGLI